MGSLYHIILCFDSPTLGHTQLALDYWSGSEVEGRWEWDVSIKELAALHGVAHKDVPKLVKTTAIAVNLANRCADCDHPEVLSSRSSVVNRHYGDFVCTECLQARNRARIQRQAEEERKRLAPHREHIAMLSQRNETFDYDEIGYAEAVITFSIMLASDEACEDGSFKQSDSLHLCESTSLSNRLLARLFDVGILRVCADTDPRAFEMGQGETWGYYPHLVHWSLAPDVQGRSFPAILKFLGEVIDGRENETGYEEAVEELWKMLAYDDAVSHLTREVEVYRLPDVRVGPKTDEAIWHALEHFSIPQVRREITNVVKNAAALSQRRDFDRRHALNTIPGTLISYVDRAISEGWQISPQLRNWQNEEPIVLTVLFNRVLGTGLPGFKTLSAGDSVKVERRKPVAKKSEQKARQRTIPPLEVPAVDPEEMGFCYGVFQGALRGRLAAPDPLRRGVDFESDVVAMSAKLMLPESLQQLFTVVHGRLTPTDIPFHRACFAVLEHYKDHPNRQAFFLRISAFYFFINKHGIEPLSKYANASEEGPDVLLIHPAVMEGVATAQLTHNLAFQKKSLLKVIDKLIRDSSAGDETK